MRREIDNIIAIGVNRRSPKYGPRYQFIFSYDPAALGRYDIVIVFDEHKEWDRKDNESDESYDERLSWLRNMTEMRKEPGGVLIKV